jgi:hypothetical protein
MDCEMLSDFVHYYSNGDMTWKPRTVDLYIKHGIAERGIPNLHDWNHRHTDRPAFATLTKNGRLYGDFFGKRLSAAAVVWAIHVKKWPNHYLHHINGNKADNRIENLSSIRTNSFLKDRLNLMLRSTDRLKLHDNGVWAFRNGEAFKWLSPAKTHGEIGAISRKMDMDH